MRRPPDSLEPLDPPDPSPGSSWWSRLGAVAVLAILVLPLWRGLGGADLGNDEAIYSQVSERMVASGDWLDFEDAYGRPFYEKPPLKFWLVAGVLELGAPWNEAGLRLLDGLFAVAALAYVIAIGWLLAGPLCGLGAAALLAVNVPLLFYHGLRSNNMEAMLLLAYCGGVFHFLCWQRRPPGRGGPHPFACVGWFAFAILGKFVAGLFLPLVVVAGAGLAGAGLAGAGLAGAGLAGAGLAGAGGRSGLRQRAAEWLWPGLLAAVLILPWFGFAAWYFGPDYFDSMFKAHVVRRFTGSLDPSHLQPWSYYLTELYASLGRSRAVITLGVPIACAGVLLGRWRQGWIPLAWFALPVALLSLGSSKLLHYAFPFLPGLTLLAAAPWAGVWRWARARPAAGIPRGRLAWGLWLVVAGAVALAVVTSVAGPVRAAMPAVMLSNASVGRPLIVALVLGVLLRGGWRRMLATIATVWLVSTIAVDYGAAWRRAGAGTRPLGQLIECLTAHAPDEGPLIYVHADWSDVLGNDIQYYSRRLPLLRLPDPTGEELERRLTVAEELAAVVLWNERLERLERTPWWGNTLADVARLEFERVTFLLPGPYCACAPVRPAWPAGSGHDLEPALAPR